MTASVKAFSSMFLMVSPLYLCGFSAMRSAFEVVFVPYVCL